jgi:enterobactin synthetase component D
MRRHRHCKASPRVPHHLMMDFACRQFMSWPRRVDVEVSDGMVLTAQFHNTLFKPEFFDCLKITRPTSIEGAVPLRQAEFLAGRLIARDVLMQIVGYDGEVPIGREGMPVWPPGVYGSISHTRTSVYCVAAVGHSRRIGIDCEDIVSEMQAAELAKFVLSPKERELLRQSTLDFKVGFTLFFSAKECFFKAVYPSLRRYIDFLEVEVRAINEKRKLVTVSLMLETSEDLVPDLDVLYILDFKNVVTIAP